MLFGLIVRCCCLSVFVVGCRCGVCCRVLIVGCCVFVGDRGLFLLAVRFFVD